MKPGTRVRINNPRSCFHDRTGIVVVPCDVGDERGFRVLLDDDGDRASMRFGTWSVEPIEQPEPHMVAGE